MWEWPEQPWNRLHLDFAGPFLGHQFLVLVDSHSKWMEAHIMTSITASRRMIFATHGLPAKISIVTDNGPTFISHEFHDFLKECGILHVTSAPYHPATNGLAERGMQTLKQGLQKLEGNMQDRLSRFLFFYRLSPHATTGVSPAEVLLGRQPRSRLDLLHPDLAQKVCQC